MIDACIPLTGAAALWVVLYKGEYLAGISGGVRLVVGIGFFLLLGRGIPGLCYVVPYTCGVFFFV